MVQLYGRNMTRREVAAHAGALSQFAGVRLMTLGDGVERGIRVAEFRTGTGLRFTVLVDRAFDIGDCEYNGMAIGWHSASGFRHPGLHEYEGEGGLGFLRSFSGLLVTCGLDHMLGSAAEDAAHYLYPRRDSITHSIHGRIGFVPGRLTGYGEVWDGDECTLFCEGIVQQSAVFAENLHLHRRIEAKVGSSEIVLRDRVVNRGFNRTPHMLLYHVDVGYPLLAEGARYIAPVRDVMWAGHAGENYRKQGVGYRTMAGPRPNFAEQVWEHAMGADADGRVPVMLANEALGLGFVVESRLGQLPCHFEWQNLQEGNYTLGLEPATHHVLGRDFAKSRGEMIWLEHDDARDYELRFRVLDGAAELAATAERISAIAPQPQDEYPAPSGTWPALR
jgi:hypothetical protein